MPPFFYSLGTVINILNKKHPIMIINKLKKLNNNSKNINR